MLKKTISIIALVGGMMLYAGPNNYVGISDIKDALYYLIKDYKKLLNKSGNNTKEISKTKEEMNKEFEALKKAIKERNIKVDNNLSKLFEEVKSLNKRAIFIKGKEDKYDKYIDAYVKDNDDVLKKIKK